MTCLVISGSRLACGISGELGQETKVSVPLSKTELIWQGEGGELGSYPVLHLVLTTSLRDKQGGKSFSPFYR